MSARRVVDADGTVLWEDEPLRVPGALSGVICDAGVVVDDPLARRELARATGAAAVDMESAALAATGRLAGVVRAISDTPERPVGRLAHAAVPDGRTDWGVVAEGAPCGAARDRPHRARRQARARLAALRGSLARAGSGP